MLSLDRETMQMLRKNQPNIRKGLTTSGSALSRHVMDELGVAAVDAGITDGPAVEALLQSRPARTGNIIQESRIQGLDVPGRDRLRADRLENEQIELATNAALEIKNGAPVELDRTTIQSMDTPAGPEEALKTSRSSDAAADAMELPIVALNQQGEVGASVGKFLDEAIKFGRFGGSIF